MDVRRISDRVMEKSVKWGTSLEFCSRYLCLSGAVNTRQEKIV